MGGAVTLEYYIIITIIIVLAFFFGEIFGAIVVVVVVDKRPSIDRSSFKVAATVVAFKKLVYV
jgi:hypothetical protein